MIFRLERTVCIATCWINRTFSKEKQLKCVLFNSNHFSLDFCIRIRKIMQTLTCLPWIFCYIVHKKKKKYKLVTKYCNKWFRTKKLTRLWWKTNWQNEEKTVFFPLRRLNDLSHRDVLIIMRSNCVSLLNFGTAHIDNILLKKSVRLFKNVEDGNCWGEICWFWMVGIFFWQQARKKCNHFDAITFTKGNP